MLQPLASLIKIFCSSITAFGLLNLCVTYTLNVTTLRSVLGPMIGVEPSPPRACSGHIRLFLMPITWMSKDGPFRRWCYTNFLDADGGDGGLEAKLRDVSGFRGLCYQPETCPSSGRVHHQGYVEFTVPKRRSALAKLLKRVHWEPAKGSRAQCVDYCTKRETRFGEPVIDPVLLTAATQGKRNDLLEITLGITRGEITRDELFTDRPDLVCKYSRGLGELFNWRARQTRQGDRQQHVEILWGDAGVGKTRYAYTSTEPEDVFILNKSNAGNLWWDHYEGQGTLLIDDFYGWIEHSQLLRVLDRYPLRLDVKNSTTYAAWRVIYITSNRHPSTWYSKSFPWEEDDSLRRRLDGIWHCKKSIFGSVWTEEETDRKRNIDHEFNIRET